MVEKCADEKLNDRHIVNVVEATVREHPIKWFLGALGVGLVLAMLVQKSRD